MLASRLFLWGMQKDPRRYQELFTKFKSYLLELLGFMEQQMTLMSDSGKYRVRFEFFCKTKDFDGDVRLPKLELPDLIWVCDHEMIEKHMMSEINAIGKPLRDLYDHIHHCEIGKILGIKMWDALGDKLGPNRMTTAIYCLEKAVQLMNIINNSQYGRITTKIWELLDSEREDLEEESNMFFAIPEICVEKIVETSECKMCLCNANIFKKSSAAVQEDIRGRGNDAAQTRDLELMEAPDDSEEESERMDASLVCHLLKNTLYSYKRMDLSTRLTEKDLRNLPKHTQTLGGQMTKDSILPKGEEHLMAKIAQAFFEFSEKPASNNPRGTRYSIPVFQRRHFRMSYYRSKTEQEINSFLDTLSRIMWEAYDLSWFTAWKQRKWHRTQNELNYTTSADMSLENFPTTKKSFDLWHQSQISPTSATLVQSNMDSTWISNTAVITSPEMLFLYCFKECIVARNSRWNKLLSVRIFKEICCRLRAVECYLRSRPDHNSSTINMWRITFFLEHLFQSMSSCRRRKSDDNSKFMVWDIRSSDKKYWSWQKIRPILVMDVSETAELSPILKLEEPLTMVSGKIYSSPSGHMFPFDTEAEKRKSPGGNSLKDRFFEIIKPPQYKREKYLYRLNYILALRTILSFEDKLEMRNVNTETCPAHLIFNDKNIQFGKVFGSSKKAFMDCIKNCKKRYWKPNECNREDRKRTPIEIIALMNHKHWDCSEQEELKIFTDEVTNERAMRYYIDHGDRAQALRLAHCGIITEDFLVMLIEMRDKYCDIKGEEDGVILGKLGIDWTANR